MYMAQIVRGCPLKNHPLPFQKHIFICTSQRFFCPYINIRIQMLLVIMIKGKCYTSYSASCSFHLTIMSRYLHFNGNLKLNPLLRKKNKSLCEG